MKQYHFLNSKNQSLSQSVLFVADEQTENCIVPFYLTITIGFAFCQKFYISNYVLIF